VKREWVKFFTFQVFPAASFLKKVHFPIFGGEKNAHVLDKW
jgi:hypothetical protein